MKRILSLLFLLYNSLTLLAQDDTKYITLLKEPSLLRTTSFHITCVLDNRTDTTQIGILHTGFTGKKEILLKFRNGLPASLTEFIHNNYKQDTSTTPVELHITRLQSTHTRTGLKSRNDVSLGLAFYTKGEKITDFNGDGYSEGPGDPSKAIEELIRKNLESGLEKFDTWWARNKNQFAGSGGAPTDISVEALIVNTVDENDMIAYTFSRPLTLNDFSGDIDKLSMASAVTYSGIQVRSTSEMKDGKVKVKVYITPYFNKTRSWCRKSSRNAKTLAHEQRHFDITAMKACDLQQAVQKFTFTSNFIKEVELLHKQNEKDWDLLQRTYDTETRHGLNATAQQKWDKQVKAELAKRSCIK